MKKIPINFILYIVMFLMAGLLVLSVSMQSQQAAMTIPFSVHFLGEYSQAGGEWKQLDMETDLSAYEGDIVIRGRFDMELSEGTEIRVYLNHIGMDIYKDGKFLYESSYEKNIGMCGNAWVVWTLPEISPEDVLEIRLHNPHSFGNRNAYNQFLNSIYMGSDVAMKSYFERQDMPYQIISIFILVASVALIGTAVGYLLLRLPGNRLLLKSGIMSLMMGIYIYLDVKDISLWSVQIAFNTCVRRLAMMIAAWLMAACVAELLHEKCKRMADIAVYILMGIDFVLFVVSLAGIMELYDTGIYWAAAQGIVSLFLLVLMIREVGSARKYRGLLQFSVIILLIVLLFELINAYTGWWTSGICIKIVFTVLFVFHLIRSVWLVAKNQQDSIRAEKLQMELRNSRIVLAMSQIRTHFVFNILNAISGMCEYDPKKADETLVMFSRYLRSNINIMEEDEPEPFIKALDYLEKYVYLEQVRFGDKIQFEKNIETENFEIPPLVLQPLVENAIRHGLLHKKQGGTISLHSWMENGENIIEITDNGVGFDMADTPQTESVGIKNVRFRLKYMVDGAMDIKSTKGQGTIVTIRIPGKQSMQKTE